MVRTSGVVTCLSVVALSTCLLVTPAMVGGDIGYAKNEKSDDRGNNGQSDKAGGNGRSDDLGKSRGLGRPPQKASNAAKSNRGQPYWLLDEDGNPIRGNGKKVGNGQRGLNAEVEGEDGYEDGDEVGNLRSQMGALNAAHANPRALERASENSRVGRIAAYKAGLETIGNTAQELADAKEKLAGMEAPERELEAIRSDLSDASQEVSRLEGVIAELEGIEGSDAELAQAREDLVVARAQLRDYEDELNAAEDYENAVVRVDELEDDLETSEADALHLLELAANKPLSNSVIAEVNRLLGLEEVVLLLPEEVPVEETGTTSE